MVRKLAAILAADVVGFSRLMHEDEAGTLTRLKSLRRELVQPRIGAGNGRIVKLMGDGLLAEFPSIVDAVRCAVDIQREMVRGVVGRGIRLRIGVNIGDVIVEGSDIYGDGVNLAARLESFAEPGGICISGKVYDEVRNRLPDIFRDLGEQQFKNMPASIRVYSWSGDTTDPAPASVAGEDKTPPIPDRPSIAVLPFDNMSDDPEQEFFADGMSEDLITALSKIRWFFVIARNSTFSYKGHAVEVTQIARELGVRYVIEGSVRKAGNRIRVTAQLIDATTGRHVWAERYDRDLSDIFELQDEMTQTIVGAVEPELSAAERERAVRSPPENLDAWETYQRGLWYLWNFNREDNAEAQRLLGEAQKLDPGFATAYAYAAYSHYLDAMLGFTDAAAESLDAAWAAAKKARALDDKDPVACFALGRVHSMRGDHDASVAELETAISLNPSFAQAHHGLGCALIMSGRLEDAAASLDRAMRFSPRDPVMWGTMCYRSLTCNLQGEHEAAAEWARKATSQPRAAGGGYWPYAVLASALGNLGKIAKAREALDEALRRKPGLSLQYLRETLPTKQAGGLQPYYDGLQAAGLGDRD